MPSGNGDIIVVVHRVPVNVTPLHTWFSDSGTDVVLITTTTAASGYIDAGMTVVALQDYTCDEELNSAVARIATEGTIQRLICGTEDDLLRCAKIRADFGIPGMSVDAALAFTDKLLMKQFVSTAGVRTPIFSGADDESLTVIRDELRGQVVLKPRSDFGAKDVQILERIEEIPAIRGDRDDLMVEEYVEGEVFHVDGLMDRGRVLFAYPSKYVNTCLSFHDELCLGSMQLAESDGAYQPLLHFAAEVVGALPPVDYVPFHLEVFRATGTGDWVFCEIGARVGGGFILQGLLEKFGINVVEATYRREAGLPNPVAAPSSPGLHGWVLVPPKRGELLGYRDDVTFPPEIRTVVRHSDLPRQFADVDRASDTVMSFDVVADDADALFESLATGMDAATSSVIWKS